MANRPATFQQRDVERALKAAQAAGVRVGCYEIALDGSAIRIWAEGEAPPPKPAQASTWDDL